MEQMAVLARNLTVKRGHRTIFDRIGFAISMGQVTGLLGPSGCGKTTLMRSIVGVQAKVQGDVQVLGQPAGSRGLRRRVAYATQASSVYDDLTVQQNIHFFARVLGVPDGDADRVIELVGLQDYAPQRVDALSGGQRGRVSLAAALLGTPELIVLDEPTVGLDPVLRSDLWELFHKLANDGAALVMSSHVMDEALRCDRLLLMREGQFVADTTPIELLKSTGARDAESAFLDVIKAGGLPAVRATDVSPLSHHKPGEADQRGRHSSGDQS